MKYSYVRRVCRSRQGLLNELLALQSPSMKPSGRNQIFLATPTWPGKAISCDSTVLGVSVRFSSEGERRFCCSASHRARLLAQPAARSFSTRSSGRDRCGRCRPPPFHAKMAARNHCRCIASSSTQSATAFPESEKLHLGKTTSTYTQGFCVRKKLVSLVPETGHGRRFLAANR